MTPLALLAFAAALPLVPIEPRPEGVRPPDPPPPMADARPRTPATATVLPLSSPVSSPLSWYGYVDGAGRAVAGETWTFDHAPGPSLEGWTSRDQTGDNDFIAGRRMTPAQWTARGGTGPAPTFGTNGSLWIGLFEGEADSSCFVSGAGYGNHWFQEARSGNFYSLFGWDFEVSMKVFNDTETGYDFTRVILRDLTAGTDAVLATHTGVVGSPAVGVLQEFEVPSIVGHNYQLVFQFRSDVSFSDEDGLYATDGGAFAVDDIVVAAATFTLMSANFESNAGSFTFAAPPGIGAVAHIYSLTEPLPCVSNAILTFFNDLAGHTPGQSEVLLSPAISLAGFGSDPTIIAKYAAYLDNPCYDGVFYGVGFSYYPCGTGADRWSPPVYRNLFYSNTPQCVNRTEFDRYVGGDLVPSGADSVRLAITVVQSCPSAVACAGFCTEGYVSQGPVFDNIRLGVVSSGVHFVPGPFYPTIQAAIDSAADGDTILVAEGVYTGTGNKNLDFGDKGLVLLSESGSGATILDLQGSGRGFLFDNGPTSATLVCGFTVRNGNAPDGTGVIIVDSSPVFRECVFEENTAISTTGSVIKALGAAAEPVFEACTFRGNSGGDGTIGGTSAAHITMTGCLIEDNEVSGDGGGLRLSGCTATLTDCVIRRNTAGDDGGGLYMVGGVSADLIRCDISENVSPSQSGGVHAANSSLTMTGCTVRENVATMWGGLYLSAMSGLVQLTDCDIAGNEATSGEGGGLRVIGSTALLDDVRLQGNKAATQGGAIMSSLSTLTLEACLVTGNLAAEGGAIRSPSGTLTIRQSTVAGNRAGTSGGGLDVVSSAVAAIEQSIVYGNCAAVSGSNRLTPSSPVNVTCSIIETVGLVGSPAFDADTRFHDPEFCEPKPCGTAPTTAGDYRLAWASPARATYSPCGLHLGSGEPGSCIGPTPYLTSVTDVPDDQGGQVELSWWPSSNDSMDGSVTHYFVYRGVDLALNVPATGAPAYTAIAPTLCDSTLHGPCPSTFRVSARTVNPIVKFDSPPRVGSSVDNLPPGAPTNVTLSGTGVLSWDSPGDVDLSFFSFYGSNLETFDESAVFIDSTVALEEDVSLDPYPYYYVTATDDAGNEGPAGAAQNQSAVGDGARPVGGLSVGLIRPNPFRGRTAVSFNLPASARVRFDIFDVRGRLVRTILDASLEPGPHTVDWDGTDREGRRVAPGAYLFNIADGKTQVTRKALFLR